MYFSRIQSGEGCQVPWRSPDEGAKAGRRRAVEEVGRGVGTPEQFAREVDGAVAMGAGRRGDMEGYPCRPVSGPEAPGGTSQYVVLQINRSSGIL